MFNTPYYNYGYREQPIQNIINTQPNMDSNLFMAKFIKGEENAKDIFINNKTAFINLDKKELIIKEINGDFIKYGLILPKDEKDLKIEALERQILELKERVNNNVSSITTTNEIEQQTSDSGKSNKSKSTTK